ncbi:MAG: hypothetical protein ACR2OV_11325 [Hyphomicrobiaceae bacterium]
MTDDKYPTCEGRDARRALAKTDKVASRRQIADRNPGLAAGET